MNIVIAERDADSLCNLTDLLKKFFPNEIISGFLCAEQASVYAREHKSEILFTEVELEGSSGFELIEELRNENPSIYSVVVSNKPDYVIEAFSFHAEGYIVKPVTEKALKDVLKNFE